MERIPVAREVASQVQILVISFDFALLFYHVLVIILLIFIDLYENV